MKRAALLLALLAPACAGLQPPPAQPVSTYVLEAGRGAQVEPPQGGRALAVSVPRARAGFEGAQMAYVTRDYELAYFAAHRWAEAPARMLAPLMAQALEDAGCWRAVVRSPGAAGAELRLESELVRLVQDFRVKPSRVRLTLRVELIDPAARRVLALRELDELEPAASDDPYGGVAAANRALERLLGRLGELCAAAPG
jgi:cholesterol transport system auxiliary component